MAKRNGKGCGGLIKRGGLWTARWTVGGKVYTRATGTANKREAERLLAEYVHPFQIKDEARRLEGITARLQGVRAEVARHEDGKPALTVAAAFAAYSRSTDRPQRASEEMLARYEGYMGAFRRWLEAHYPDAEELRHVSRAIADEYATALKAKTSPGTFNKHLTLLRSLWAVLDEAARLGGANPWAKMRKLPLDAHGRRALTVDELTRVCGSVTGEMRVLFALGIYTGLRLGDCALMDWGKVDMTRRVIVTVPRKIARNAHAREVVIPMHGALYAILDETGEDARRGYLLPHTAAEYLRDASIVTGRVQGVFAAAGIATHGEAHRSGRASVLVGFHSLRHTFVSLAGNAGAPLAVVQSIVGHANPMMTAHYYHAGEGALKTAVCALPDVGGMIARDGEGGAAEGRFRAFCAAWAALQGDEERERARKFIEDAAKGAGRRGAARVKLPKNGNE